MASVALFPQALLLAVCPLGVAERYTQTGGAVLVCRGGRRAGGLTSMV